MTPATRPCPACDGRGTTARGRRLLEGGQPDPLDIIGRFPELCATCAGNGRVPETAAAKPQKQPGHVADI